MSSIWLSLLAEPAWLLKQKDDPNMYMVTRTTTSGCLVLAGSCKKLDAGITTVTPNVAALGEDFLFPIHCDSYGRVKALKLLAKPQSCMMAAFPNSDRSVYAGQALHIVADKAPMTLLAQAARLGYPRLIMVRLKELAPPRGYKVCGTSSQYDRRLVGFADPSP